VVEGGESRGQPGDHIVSQSKISLARMLTEEDPDQLRELSEENMIQLSHPFL